MTMPFSRQDIAKAFFGLDLSDTQSSVNSNRPMPSRPDPQVTIRSPTTNKTNIRPALLALPAEIRLQIYDLLLVSRFDREQNPSRAVGNTCQKAVSLHMIQAPEYRTMAPAILRTCRQIQHEANSILYSKNVFYLSEPKQMLRFMTQIGPTNIKLVRSLDMWIPWMADLCRGSNCSTPCLRKSLVLSILRLDGAQTASFLGCLREGLKREVWVTMSPSYVL